MGRAAKWIANNKTSSPPFIRKGKCGRFGSGKKASWSDQPLFVEEISSFQVQPCPFLGFLFKPPMATAEDHAAFVTDQETFRYAIDSVPFDMDERYQAALSMIPSSDYSISTTTSDSPDSPDSTPTATSDSPDSPDSTPTATPPSDAPDSTPTATPPSDSTPTTAAPEAEPVCPASEFRDSSGSCKPRKTCEKWEVKAPGGPNADDTCAPLPGCGDKAKHFFNETACVPRKVCNPWESTVDKTSTISEDNQCVPHLTDTKCHDLKSNYYDAATKTCKPRPTSGRCKVYQTLPNGSESNKDAVCITLPECNAPGVWYNPAANKCVPFSTNSELKCAPHEKVQPGTLDLDATCVPKENCQDLSTHKYNPQTDKCERLRCNVYEVVKDGKCVKHDSCGRIGFETNGTHWDMAAGKCVPNTECQADEYQTTPPQVAVDRTCIKHKTCASDEYMAHKGTSELDTDCKKLTVCNPGSHYLFEGPKKDEKGQNVSDNKCVPHAPACTDSQYEVQAPSATKNRICKPLNPCKPGFGTRESPQRKAGGGPFVSDYVCIGAGDCDANSQYFDGSQCRSITVCDPETQYETSAPGPRKDRTCATSNKCTDDQYESVPLGKSTPRTCAARRKCGAGQTSLHEYNPHKNTECIPNKACDGDSFSPLDCARGHRGQFNHLRYPGRPNQHVKYGEACLAGGAVEKINKMLVGPDATHTYPFQCFYTGGAGSYIRMTTKPGGRFDGSGNWAQSSEPSQEARDRAQCSAWANKVAEQTGIQMKCNMGSYRTARYHYLGTEIRA